MRSTRKWLIAVAGVVLLLALALPGDILLDRLIELLGQRAAE